MQKIALMPTRDAKYACANFKWKYAGGKCYVLGEYLVRVGEDSSSELKAGLQLENKIK